MQSWDGPEFEVGMIARFGEEAGRFVCSAGFSLSSFGAAGAIGEADSLKAGLRTQRL